MDKREADFNSEKSTVSLKVYLENSLRELEKRVDQQFLAAKEAVGTAMVAAEKAVSAALVAQDKQTQAAFIAAKEALAEAQVQLTLYKAQSNEWRQTLTDLIATLMLRPEIVATFKALESRIDSLASKIDSLEKSGQFISGQSLANQEGRASGRWTFEKALAILAILISLGVAVLKFKQ